MDWQRNEHLPRSRIMARRQLRHHAYAAVGDEATHTSYWTRACTSQPCPVQPNTHQQSHCMATRSPNVRHCNAASIMFNSQQCFMRTTGKQTYQKSDPHALPLVAVLCHHDQGLRTAPHKEVLAEHVDGGRVDRQTKQQDGAAGRPVVVRDPPARCWVRLLSGPFSGVLLSRLWVENLDAGGSYSRMGHRQDQGESHHHATTPRTCVMELKL